MRTTWIGAAAGLALGIGMLGWAPAVHAQTREELRKAIETLEKAIDRLDAEQARPAALEPVTYERLMKVLEELGREPKLLRSGEGKPLAIRFMAHGYRAVVFLEPDNGIMQFSLGVTDTRVTADKLNRWNRTKRFTRAFTKEVKGKTVATLEGEYDVADGRTDERLRLSVQLFAASIDAFHEQVCK